MPSDASYIPGTRVPGMEIPRGDVSDATVFAGSKCLPFFVSGKTGSKVIPGGWVSGVLYGAVAGVIAFYFHVLA